MNNNKEVSAYSSLRIGFILMSLSEIILFVWLIIILNLAFQVVSSKSLNFTAIPTITASELNTLKSFIVSAIWIEVLGAILGILASIFLYIGFYRGKGYFNVGNAVIGAILVLIGFIFYVFIPVIGVIIGIIGFIFMKSSLDSIGNKYNEKLVNSGAILSIIPIISIIGTLIAALGLTKVINKAKSNQMLITRQLSPVNVSQLIQQVGLGVIKENGEIFLTLYSQIQGIIVSVKIEGSPYSSTLSIPLQIGNNNIVINLGTTLNLVKSSIYKITLSVSTSSSIILITTDAIYNPSSN